MKQEKWMRWERVSSIMPLFIPLEAGIEKMTGYFGVAWPRTILIYSGKNVAWRNRWTDLYKLGQKLIDFFSKKGNEKKYWQDWRRETKILEKFFERIEKLNFKKLSNDELIRIFKDYVEVYESWWKYGWASTTIALQAEVILSKHGLEEKEFSSLLNPPQKSFAAEIEDDLAFIVGTAKKRGMNSPTVRKKIRNHASTYFWKSNNYLETRVLTENDVRSEVELILKEWDPKIEKEESSELGKLNKETQFLAGLLSNFAYYKDYRKKHQMIAGHYLDQLTGEVGRRVGFSPVEMRYTLPHEIESVFENKITRAEIRKRQKSCLIDYGKTLEVYVGTRAKEVEAEIFGDSSFEEVNEVKGWGASQGNVTGKVRIIMDPKEVYLLKKGEILVTAMTSPDFVIAMKKAAAIVTDWGGVTSHAAIVSREFGIPCVVATNSATKVFKDGDLVQVDAVSGVVRKLKQNG